MSDLFRRTLGWLRLSALFVYELVVSSIKVAWDVMTPTHLSRPGIIAVPLDTETDVEITVFANLICLTPGTLSLEVSADRRRLYVHAMFIDDPVRDCQALKASFERRVIEALR
jgi:multicomponent Na+:H+ antiporter subunit E